MPSAVIDRRTALKARHRAAILSAAAALVAEHDGPDFGVDELAARADVARRTVFNHFGSLDEVLLSVCTVALTVLVDDFLTSVASTAMGDGSRASMLDELAVALRESDLPTAIATVHQVIGGSRSLRDRAIDFARAGFSRTGDLLRREVARRNPAADDLDVDLLVGSVMSGLSVISRRWIDLTGAALDDASRAEWDQLLARLLHSVRSGYMPT
jgi:AcrR family transcriptional regulator